MTRAYVYAEWYDGGWGFKWCNICIIGDFMFIDSEWRFDQ